VVVQVKFEQYEKWRSSSQELVDIASDYAPLSGEWHLNLQLFDSSNSWRYWALDNGAVFSENIPNGPWTFNKTLDDCPTECLNLTVNDTDGKILIDIRD
jgi:hypothetical protein